jgi:hypothetical protein
MYFLPGERKTSNAAKASKRECANGNKRKQ